MTYHIPQFSPFLFASDDRIGYVLFFVLIISYAMCLLSALTLAPSETPSSWHVGETIRARPRH
jgi:hypothetical protein